MGVIEQSPAGLVQEGNCKAVGCPMTMTLDVIGGKWKGMILYHLTSGTRRFNELMRLMPEVTQRMLTRQLRELEEHGVINRKVYAEVPPKVEYSLSELGLTLLPVIRSLSEWGRMYGALEIQRLVVEGEE
jgi:DNA-binding HxlR family transcriptional regulator